MIRKTYFFAKGGKELTVLTITYSMQYYVCITYLCLILHLLSQILTKLLQYRNYAYLTAEESDPRYHVSKTT